MTLVSCTLGEMGEILVDDWAHFTPEELGRHRLQELATALGIMGVTDHVWLGGPGRYHDSGMGRDEHGNACPPDVLPDGAFWSADLLEAANHLVEVIRSRRPHVVSTYDPFGGYGHPDHIQAHRVTMYACLLAGVTGHRPDLGDAWVVPRVLWNTHNTLKWREAVMAAREQGLTLFGDSDEDNENPSANRGPDPSQIVAVVPYGQYVTQATEALLAHRSQVDATNEFWQFFEIMRRLDGAGEAYMFAAGQPFPKGDAPATDIFAGLDLN